MLGIGAVELVARAAASLPFKAHAVASIVLASVALWGRHRLRARELTVRTVLLAFQLLGWPLAAALAQLGWTAAELGRAAPILNVGVVGTAALAILVCAVQCAFQLRSGTLLYVLYDRLGAYLGAGEISEAALYDILSFGGTGRGSAPLQIVLVGLASTGTYAARVLFGGNTVGIAASIFILFAAVPGLLGVLAARLILQKRTLGSRDLIVVTGDQPLFAGRSV